jgi:hypothetical protein
MDLTFFKGSRFNGWGEKGSGFPASPQAKERTLNLDSFRLTPNPET